MQRVSFFLFLTLILTACSSALPPTSQPLTAVPQPGTLAKKSSLPDLGTAPELTNTTWLNVAAPLRLANLRGQVVLIDMWTFG